MHTRVVPLVELEIGPLHEPETMVDRFHLVLDGHTSQVHVGRFKEALPIPKVFHNLAPQFTTCDRCNLEDGIPELLQDTTGCFQMGSSTKVKVVNDLTQVIQQTCCKYVLVLKNSPGVIAR